MIFTSSVPVESTATTSPCVNAGSNALVPPGVVFDILGNDRFINGIVDLGAVEGAAVPIDPVTLRAFDLISTPPIQKYQADIEGVGRPRHLFQVDVIGQP